MYIYIFLKFYYYYYFLQATDSLLQEIGEKLCKVD